MIDLISVWLQKKIFFSFFSPHDYTIFFNNKKKTSAALLLLGELANLITSETKTSEARGEKPLRTVLLETFLLFSRRELREVHEHIGRRGASCGNDDAIHHGRATA
jgi:hypothetical protein